VLIELPAHEELLDAFYRDLYLPAFAHQREPLEVWQARLRGELTGGYTLRILIEGEALLDPARRRLDGGIVFEVYPESGCALLTYLVVAPAARRQGVGRGLLDRARAVVGDAALVLGEISDPRKHDDDAAWRRLAQFQRWGGCALDVRYVQPDLGFGRNEDLVLVAFDPPPIVDGETLRTFLRELFVANEGRAPEPEILASVPDQVVWHAPGTTSIP
jgi:GNAT superfamily N-acetyltransferase